MSSLPPSDAAEPGMLRRPAITVLGAGITGLWQALTLARGGYVVELVERSPATTPFIGAASQYAGAMLAPDCEAESAPVLVRDLGRDAIARWQAVYPGLVQNGSLVVALPREPGELARYARVTEGHRRVAGPTLAALEPDLAAHVAAALHYPGEAHMSAPDALAFLLAAVSAAGVRLTFGVEPKPSDFGAEQTVVDCRGLGAVADLGDLRGVRGERVVVRARDVSLSRPVRLLHPRIPLYIVPWTDGLFMIGATVIESSDGRPMTVRSAVEILSAACLVHPGFAEAEIVSLGAGVRPAFADNVPRVVVEAGGRTLRVNGAYRHGFLLAPMLAEAVSGFLSGTPDSPLLVRH
jgi:glycine oxidase